MPLLSVVIPYHNNQLQLDRLLDSIADFPEIEILIVDDQSDVPPEVSMRREASARLLETTASRRWAGSARNIGLAAATGKFVCFADNDDRFVVEGVEALLEFLPTAHFDVCIARVKSASEDEASTARRHIKYNQILDRYKDSGAVPDLLRYHVPWGKIYRREFLQSRDIGFDEIVASNDVMFSIRATVYANRIAVFDREIYCVTESVGSLTKSNSKPVLEARFWALCRYNDFLRSNGYGDYTGAMSGQLFRLFRFHHLFFWKAIAVVVSRRYRIFYGIDHIKQILARYV